MSSVHAPKMKIPQNFLELADEKCIVLVKIVTFSGHVFCTEKYISTSLVYFITLALCRKDQFAVLFYFCSVQAFLLIQIQQL